MDFGDEVVVTMANKSDSARNIELFDVKHLTPENIEYMFQVVREYFKQNFPVKPEIVDDILGHMKIVDNATFKEALAKWSERVEDVDVKYGFYDKENNVGYINQDRHYTIGELFVTIFHESLHAVSISAGAGFRGKFSFPFSPDDFEHKKAMERGLIALVEGTTHYITLKCVIGGMGFDGTSNMLRYKAERSVMSRIWEAFPEEALYRAYFETPIEEIRRYFDATVSSDSQELETKTNGQFANFLINIGVATEQAQKLLDSGDEDEAAFAKIHEDIMHAVGYFLVYEHRATGKTFTEVEKAELKDYLQPYLNDI